MAPRRRTTVRRTTSGMPAANAVQKNADPRTQLDLSEIGRTGLKIFAGRDYEEWLPELTGERWWRVVKEMSEQDSVVGGVLYAIELILRQSEFSWRPADSSPASRQVADFYDTLFDDMSSTWQDTMTDILTMLPWGYAYMELVLKLRGGDVIDPTRRSRYNDGRIGIRKISIRSQDSLLRWEIDASGGTQGMWQMAPPAYIPTLIPIEKALLFRLRPRKNNPQGFSLLRPAYRDWYFKKHIMNLTGIGVERDLAGLPVAWVPAELLAQNPSGAQAASLAAILKTVTNIRRDEQEGLAFPLVYDEGGRKLYDLTLMTSGGARQFDTLAIMQYLDSRIALTMMADFLLLGHEQVGSYALASSKTGLFSAGLGTMLDAICNVINDHLVPRLQRLNGFPPGTAPTFAHGDVQSVDLNELGMYIKNISGSGMAIFPNQDIERYLLEQAHLPVPESDISAATGMRFAPGWGPLSPAQVLPGQNATAGEPNVPGVVTPAPAMAPGTTNQVGGGGDQGPSTPGPGPSGYPA